jgi:hypothetical protein
VEERKNIRWHYSHRKLKLRQEHVNIMQCNANFRSLKFFLLSRGFITFRLTECYLSQKTTCGKSYRCHLDVYAFLVVGILKLKKERWPTEKKEGSFPCKRVPWWNQRNYLPRNFCRSRPIQFSPSANNSSASSDLELS